ncbi:MAG: hypothetical protein L0Y58_12940, partial [Verrucomicrobia subdivision 3 bacterium]|nr:hypothetical protein [Limisphaerales bacterium]
WQGAFDSSAPNIVAAGFAGSLNFLQPGEANITVSVELPEAIFRFECFLAVFTAIVLAQSGEPVTVQFIGGRDFVLVGTDDTVTAHNLQQVKGSPAGGTFSWTATPSGRVTFSNNTDLPRLTATVPSTSLLDTTLRVGYRVGTRDAIPATRRVTLRIFRFLQEKGQVIIIPKSDGYQAFQAYGVLTNPNQQVLEPGFSQIRVSESVVLQSGTLGGVPISQEDLQRIRTKQGPGVTNANSEIVDDLSLRTIDGGPLPEGLVLISSQDLFVGGFFVRQNRITQGSDNTVIIENLGPASSPPPPEPPPDPPPPDPGPEPGPIIQATSGSKPPK